MFWIAAASAVPALQCAAALSSRPPRPRGQGPPGPRPQSGQEMRSLRARRDSGGVEPRPGRLSPFRRTTAAQPADAAFTAGSSLQPQAQPSCSTATLARGLVASQDRPARVPPSHHGAWKVRESLEWAGAKVGTHSALMPPLASAVRRRRGRRTLAAPDSYSALLHSGCYSPSILVADWTLQDCSQ